MADELNDLKLRITTDTGSAEAGAEKVVSGLQGIAGAAQRVSPAAQAASDAVTRAQEAANKWSTSLEVAHRALQLLDQEQTRSAAIDLAVKIRAAQVEAKSATHAMTQSVNKHVEHLIEEGAFGVVLDARSTGAQRASYTVSRSGLEAFLQRRSR